MTLDSRDRAILTYLQADARLTNIELAERVGLSPSACLRRVRLLEEMGLAEAYVLLLNPSVAGFSGNAFVQITLAEQGRESLDRFERAVIDIGEVQACYLLAGQADYLLHVVYKNSADLERIHADILTCLPGVVRVQSILSLRTVKRTTALPI